MHKKGRHLTLEDRITIQELHHNGYSNRAIPREINCSPSTIGYELKRGTVILYNGHVKRYKATAVQSVYKDHRRECGRKCLFLRRQEFINYVQSCFSKNQIVSARALYNYGDMGLMDIKNIDLPNKLKRKTKDDYVLLTLCGRKIREFLLIKIDDKTSASVMKAFDRLCEYYGSKWNKTFKSITIDNGSEFADLSDLENVTKTLVYYAHLYTSRDKGSIERHNGIIRRFIRKEDRISVGDVDKGKLPASKSIGLQDTR